LNFEQTEENSKHSDTSQVRPI